MAGSDTKTEYLHVDCTLQDCFLFVLNVLNKIPPVSEDAQYHEGLKLAESLQKALKNTPVDSRVADNILYAICALFDETVLAAGNITWRQTPIQTRFFHSLHAGDELFERIRQALREPAPDTLMLSVFHRVLCLGFRGKFYQAPNDPELHTLIRELASVLNVQALATEGPVVINAGQSRWSRHWRSPWLIVAVGFLLVAALSLGLEHLLQVMLTHSQITH